MLPSYDEPEATDALVGGVPKRAPSLTEANKFNVMLSYCWAQQDLIKRIRAYLDRMGFVVWFDIEQMKGSVTDAMAGAVENSEAIVYCMSQKYKESANCHSEANYAHQKKKPMIPLLVDENYTPDGWLGFLLGENKPIEFFGKVTTTDALFKEQMTQLCHTLGQFTSHSVEDLPNQVEDSVGAPKKKGWGGIRNKMKLMTFNRADIVGNGGSLPSAAADVYLSVKEPSSAPSGPTVESAYLQIGGGSGVTKQNPLFTEN